MDTQHRIDCEYWHDQYPWECSCGVAERMSYAEYVRRRRDEWEAEKLRAERRDMMGRDEVAALKVMVEPKLYLGKRRDSAPRAPRMSFKKSSKR